MNRRIALWLAGTAIVLVLAFAYRTSTEGAGAPTVRLSPGGGPGVLGPAVPTRWGPVQVKVVITGGRLTDVVAVVVPDGNGEDAVINNRAVPALRLEALAAQSAQIDSVSGATVTSDGYRSSLQQALDTAHFPK